MPIPDPNWATSHNIEKTKHAKKLSLRVKEGTDEGKRNRSLGLCEILIDPFWRLLQKTACQAIGFVHKKVSTSISVLSNLAIKE